MLLRMPPTFKDWPVNTVRDWRRAADECKKVAANSRASVAELRAAIGRMEPYWK